MSPDLAPLTIVVGSGGVGKTTLAAALGLLSADGGHDTLVMTFDPSKRLKDSLGVGDAAQDREVEVEAGLRGSLHASLLDAGRTFDRLVVRYSSSQEERQRILENRYYKHLAGSLAGILEYMAVERLFEVYGAGHYQRIILDTPPTRQALDFLEAPSRIMGFLDSGALKIALKPWFDSHGKLRPTSRLGRLGRKLENYLDEVVGLDLLRDMAEFFQAFAPLFEGFRQRAQEVEKLLRSSSTRFVLVAGPGEEKIPDTLFFARHLQDAGYRLGPVVVNRVHPSMGKSSEMPAGDSIDANDGRALLAWLGERDRRGLASLRSLLTSTNPPIPLPLMAKEPTDLAALSELAEQLRLRLEALELGAEASGPSLDTRPKARPVQ